MLSRYSFVLLIIIVCLDVASSQSDAQIILELKQSLGITEVTPGFETWNSTTTICNYKGIKCDSNGAVTDIDLTSTGISGTVSFRSLCQLSSLSSLNLGSNRLYGDITTDIQNCTNLSRLDLAFNQFSGSVPDLSPLKKLQFLNISDNGFTGPFPWDSLGNLTSLQVLSLGDNSFDRTESFPVAILNLRNLTWLYLSDTNIGGEIPPAIGDLSQLVDLELADNFLTGEIPQEITKLKKLWQLELYNNSLSGKIPQGFGNLSELAYFDASMNNLEGDLYELRGLVNIVSLQLFYNQLSGEIPQEFGEFKYLTNLSLYSNMLTGEIPAKLGSWTEFDFIDVSTNMLTGEIPPDMCKKGTMTKLLLLENQLTGRIPESYANCTTLKRFRVSNNSLSGEVPAGLWGLPNLNIIDLAINKFEGTIGTEIAGAKSLNQLFLANNRFSGSIPQEIGQATALYNIDLTSNNLSGEIPMSIGELGQVLSLYLPGNGLSGEIPNSIGSCKSITDLNLSGNRLSGPIPASLGQLSRLNSLDLSDNQLSGEIPASLNSLKLSSLDLSNNDLSGAIPAALSIAAYNESFSGNPGLCVYQSYYTIQSVKQCSSGHDRESRRARIIITWFIAAFALLLAIILIGLVLKKHYAGGDSGRRKGLSWDLKSFRILTFDEQEIIDSVKLENLIGKGGSGEVYKAELASGEVVAVKHLSNGPVNSGKELSTTAMLGRRKRSATKEFEAEVETLSAIRHVNVVNLYCSITSEEWSLLVYEYMPNGSLWERLHTVEGQKFGALEWEARHEIALGAARGLEYLHHGCDRPILHRDVKSSNILLDTFYKPRIADFGLAKILQSGKGVKDSTHVIAGTHGYIAPEYAYTCKVNEKSDVYSFGVVLLELVTGRKPIEPEYGENKDIVDWIARSLNDRNSVMALIDSRIPEWAKEEALKVLRIAVFCTARSPTMRPSMKSVVAMLEEAGGCRVNPSIGVKDQKLGTDEHKDKLLK